MNAFIQKKRVLAALIFVMFIISANPPLSAAKDRRGKTVEVTLADGSRVKGELLAVKGDALLVYDRNALHEERIDLQQVVQVKIFRKSKLLTGLAVGLGIGLVIGSNPEANVHIDHYWSQTTMAFGLIGGILGAFPSFFPEIISLDVFRTRQDNLDHLKRLAREKD